MMEDQVDPTMEDPKDQMMEDQVDPTMEDPKDRMMEDQNDPTMEDQKDQMMDAGHDHPMMNLLISVLENVLTIPQTMASLGSVLIHPISIGLQDHPEHPQDTPTTSTSPSTTSSRRVASLPNSLR